MADNQGKGAGIEHLDTDNYGTWSFRMKNYLISKGLGGCIDGTATTAGSDKDQNALSQIALHVKDHHIATISQCATAKAAWDALKAVHQANNVARRQQLRRDVNSIKMGSGELLTKYFNRAKTLWQEPSATGDTLSESELVWTVLHGLPKEYVLMVSVFEASDSTELAMDARLSKLLPTEAKITRTCDDEGRAWPCVHSGRQGAPPAHPDPHLCHLPSGGPGCSLVDCSFRRPPGSWSAWASPSPSRPLAALGRRPLGLAAPSFAAQLVDLVQGCLPGGGLGAGFDPGLGSFAEAPVAGVVETLRRAATRDRMRVLTDVRALGREVGFPAVWFKGRSPLLLPEAFVRL
jgi:hypothetical protein